MFAGATIKFPPAGFHTEKMQNCLAAGEEVLN
jgi:hypothetical protein